jgi:hypothetical protein
MPKRHSRNWHICLIGAAHAYSYEKDGEICPGIAEITDGFYLQCEDVKVHQVTQNDFIDFITELHTTDELGSLEELIRNIF